MKKALLILALMGLAMGFNDVAFVAAIENEPVAVSCPPDGSPSAQSDQSTEAYRCGQVTGNQFVGQAAWNDGGTPRTICKLAFEISTIEGTVSGKTYNAKIYTLSGGNLGTLQATSDNTSGPTATGWFVLQFSTPFTTSASVNYALIFGPTAVDSMNLVWVTAGDTDNIAGYKEVFDGGTGAASFGGGSNDGSIRIYWQ
jgi:hypothetical protein